MAQEIAPILTTDLTEAIAGGGSRWRWPPVLLLLPAVMITLLFLFYPLPSRWLPPPSAFVCFLSHSGMARKT